MVKNAMPQLIFNFSLCLNVYLFLVSHDFCDIINSHFSILNLGHQQMRY